MVWPMSASVERVPMSRWTCGTGPASESEPGAQEATSDSVSTDRGGVTGAHSGIAPTEEEAKDTSCRPGSDCQLRVRSAASAEESPGEKDGEYARMGTYSREWSVVSQRGSGSQPWSAVIISKSSRV